MKLLGKLFLVLVIVVPILICFIMLNNIWKEDDATVLSGLETDKTVDITPSDNNESTATENTPPVIQEQTYQMGSEEFKSSIGAPTSKIVEGATINISVANVYINPDEKSEVVDTIKKHTVVTTQSFPNGWSRIKSDTVSGWVRTENVTLPDSNANVSVGSVIGKIGKVNVTSLNVRASASTTATIKNTLTENTEVKILEVSGDNSWYKVQWNSLEGWVSSKYITIQ